MSRARNPSPPSRDAPRRHKRRDIASTRDVSLNCSAPLLAAPSEYCAVLSSPAFIPGIREGRTSFIVGSRLNVQALAILSGKIRNVRSK